MEEFLNFTGLSHFKDKIDSANESKFVKNDALEDIINNKLTAVYTYKGTVADVSLLPQEGNKVGDVYDVNDGMNYAWNGTKWDALGDSAVTVDADLSDESVHPVQNKVIKAALDKKAGTDVASKSSNGLMSSTDKEKLDGIDPEANKYVPPESPAGAKALKLYKVATNSNGMVIEAEEVVKTDITALGIPAANTDTTYEVFDRTTDGLVPHPTTSGTVRYLREDGSWEVPPDNNTTYSPIPNSAIDELF